MADDSNSKPGESASNPDTTIADDSGSAPSTPSTTPAQSASAARGGRGRGRGQGRAAAPKKIVRRSAKEREDLEQAERQRKADEAKARDSEARGNVRQTQRGGRGGERGFRGFERGGGRGQGRGRGGFMGEERVMSGPFSAGQVSSDVKEAYKKSAYTSGGSAGASGPLSGGQASTSGASASNSGHGGSAGTGVKSETGGFGHVPYPVKTEDGGYISTDEEAESGIPRVDIDSLQSRYIDLTKDDDNYTDPMAPVRLLRYPHKERNTLATAEVGLNSTDDAEQSISEKKRGKRRSREIEITGSMRAPIRQTAYSSSSEGEGEPTIKEEPVEDDAPAVSTSEMVEGAEHPTALPDAPSSPESKRRAKEAIRTSLIDDDADDEYGHITPSPPKFYTDAERLEWQILMDDRSTVFGEIGRQASKIAAMSTRAEDDDADEAPNIRRAKLDEEVRNNNIYLFQFPPVMPPLVPVGTESTTPQSPPAPALAATTSTAAAPASKASKAPDVPDPCHPPPGRIGKLRVHRSGRATLSYGGFDMDVNMGIVKHFPQQIVLADLPGGASNKPKKDGDEDGDVKMPDAETGDDRGGGEGVAYSMGLVRGEFVVTPQLDGVLGDW